ncbi:MFS transporter [Bacillus sp. B15-48]|uniref:MFS transporter n=1 Tax=Bacillus sp. B15-48 TaxID=1548601 RepID=UPI00193F34C5|nr:MFS transporter [Bacillus sp. B15-48]MBM4762870.1 MFS transporter [Bacillus sp. B15-48]
MKNKYIYSVMGSFINYFFFGMAYILIAQNMTFLSEKLQTDNAGISFLISAFGFGRLFSLYVGGVLSDKIGRKPFVLLGATLMAIFLIGIPLSPNYQIALIFAIVGGFGNSFLDTGTNPSLMEAFPKQASRVMVLQKVFISAGSTVLPFLISFLVFNEVFYGWAFFIPAIIFLVNSIILLKVKFPHHNSQKN